ncbi:Uncharacterized protein FKW44_008277, partial [Caligus rogercresseyi]
MQSTADREYRFIMVYQDHLTKFVCLRPLKTKTADEVAGQLVKNSVTKERRKFYKVTMEENSPT